MSGSLVFNEALIGNYLRCRRSPSTVAEEFRGCLQGVYLGGLPVGLMCVVCGRPYEFREGKWQEASIGTITEVYPATAVIDWGCVLPREERG